MNDIASYCRSYVHLNNKRIKRKNLYHTLAYSLNYN